MINGFLIYFGYYYVRNLCFVEVFGNDFKLCFVRESVIMFIIYFVWFSKKLLLYLYIKYVYIYNMYIVLFLYIIIFIYNKYILFGFFYLYT